MEEDEECGGGGAGWIVSFADLMTLLFALFVVLYALKKEGDPIAIKGVTAAIRESFVDVPDDIPSDVSGPKEDGKFYFKFFKGDIISDRIKKFKRQTNPLNIINKDFAQVKQIVVNFNKINRKSTDSKSSGEVAQIFRTNKEIRLRLASSFLYKSGEYRIRNSQLKEFKKLGDVLKSLDAHIKIIGHTDDIPSPNMPNIVLSALRAGYIGKYFVEVIDIPKELVTVSGAGSSLPITSNKTKAGRLLNRRVEIHVSYEE